MNSFFNQIRLYSSRSEDKDRVDYTRWRNRLGLSPYLKKLTETYAIAIPNKWEFNNVPIERIIEKVIAPPYEGKHYKYARLRRVLEGEYKELYMDKVLKYSKYKVAN